MRGNHAADLCLCFMHYAKSRFSHDVAHILLYIKMLQDLALKSDRNQKFVFSINFLYMLS